MAGNQKNTSYFNFGTKWDIERTNIICGGTFNTKTETVEGMPDVKFYVKFSFLCASRRHSVILVLETKYEIDYTINVYYSERRDDLKKTYTGTTHDMMLIDLESVSSDNIHTYLKEGVLTIFVEGNFSYTTKSNKILKPLYNSTEWGLRLKESSPKDFEIIVENRVIQHDAIVVIIFQIHKVFIAAESPVFARMFESNFKEGKENKVTLTNVRYETVEAAINFCYRQNITPCFENLQDSIDLLYFCDKYDFQTLKPLVEKNLATKLSKQNLSILVSTSEKTNSPQLRQTCIKYICELQRKKDKISADVVATFSKEFLADVLLQSFK